MTTEDSVTPPTGRWNSGDEERPAIRGSFGVPRRYFERAPFWLALGAGVGAVLAWWWWK